MRLTKAMLDAIVYMGTVIEADGVEQLQGFMGGNDNPERENMFDQCLKASQWASDERYRRENKTHHKSTTKDSS